MIQLQKQRLVLNLNWQKIWYVIFFNDLIWLDLNRFYRIYKTYIYSSYCIGHNYIYIRKWVTLLWKLKRLSLENYLDLCFHHAFFFFIYKCHILKSSKKGSMRKQFRYQNVLFWCLRSKMTSIKLQALVCIFMTGCNSALQCQG